MTVLEQITQKVRERLDKRKEKISENELRSAIEKNSRAPQGFRAAFLLPSPQPKVIAEIKYASPSQGQILDAGAHPAIQVAHEYLKNGATALSILTEADFFHGSPDYLRQVRAAFPHARLLLKDFVLDSYQLLEARLLGADAALLMLSVLGEKNAGDLLQTSKSLGLDALVEVHDEQELKSAIQIGADLIGINNRDLKTLNISLGVSEKLIAVGKKQAKPGTVFISESGLKSGAELERFSRLGYHGFLMGTSFMKTGSPGLALKKVLLAEEKPDSSGSAVPSVNVTPKIKICGLTRFEDALLAQQLGAWALGFIFYEKSPRFISPTNAGKIIGLLPSSSAHRVGVFVDPSIETLQEHVRLSGVNAIQLHGSETPEFCEKVKSLFPRHLLFKALRLQSREELSVIAPFTAICDLILLDTFHGATLGGSGVPGNWQLAREAGQGAPILLAGGIRPENTARAIEEARPFGLDVASGVETSLGIKSQEALQLLFANAREATQ